MLRVTRCDQYFASCRRRASRLRTGARAQPRSRPGHRPARSGWCLPMAGSRGCTSHPSHTPSAAERNSWRFPIAASASSGSRGIRAHCLRRRPKYPAGPPGLAGRAGCRGPPHLRPLGRVAAGGFGPEDFVSPHTSHFARTCHGKGEEQQRRFERRPTFVFVDRDHERSQLPLVGDRGAMVNRGGQ